jgi:adenine-specific DNA-methyltransferase
MKFKTLEAIAEGSTLHAQGTWGKNGEERRVAVLFGPQYGPLTKWIVEDSIGLAVRRGFDDLVFAAFSFDDSSQAAIQADPDPKLRIHMAHIRPDANKGIGDLLKTTVSSQLFTVSGSPRTELAGPDKDGMYVAKMEGVDIYDPVENVIRSTGAEKVAAWFLDSDYDGRCFCICQAFFPDKSAWEKLGKALGGALNPDALAKLSGTTSLPFALGKHERIAIKVIDPRGNEVMRVHKLKDRYD